MRFFESTKSKETKFQKNHQIILKFKNLLEFVLTKISKKPQNFSENCRLDEEIINLFGIFLASDTSLTELCLDGNEFGDEGCKFLKEACEDNETLSKLDLGSLIFTQFFHFRQKILTNKTANCSYGEQGMVFIGDILRKNSNLKYLDISRDLRLRFCFIF